MFLLLHWRFALYNIHVRVKVMLKLKNVNFYSTILIAKCTINSDKSRKKLQEKGKFLHFNTVNSTFFLFFEWMASHVHFATDLEVCLVKPSPVDVTPVSLCQNKILLSLSQTTSYLFSNKIFCGCPYSDFRVNLIHLI